MLIATQNSDTPETPVILSEVILSFNREEEGFLRVALLTADNKPFPYLLVQIYYTPTPTIYVVNTALYMDMSIIEEIRGGRLSTMDFVIGGLRVAVTNDAKVFNVDNFESYIELLYNNQLVLDVEIGRQIDSAICDWLLNQTRKKKNKV